MKKIGKVLTTLIATAAIQNVATAADLGGEIAVGGWNHDPSGWIKYPNDLPDFISKVDVDNDLNLDTETDLYIRAKLEHPIPILPNIRVGYTKTNTSGNGRIEKRVVFGDTEFAAGTDVYSEAELKNTDGTFYYQLLDTGIDFDLGLTVRYLDGYVMISDKTTGIKDTSDVEFVVPMLYANFRWPLPFLEGLSIGAEGNWISYDGSALYDMQTDARYTLPMGLGFEVGYRYQKVKLEDVDDTDADIDISGIYGGIVWDF
ncbi:MAG: TIGR04219 family outer membrane beta-barrel protein [Epsilonproteobacteria bacterium]|nr:TIGR04219 family outer membrane beta-barrel protein [Campylobacterota bacterium]